MGSIDLECKFLSRSSRAFCNLVGSPATRPSLQPATVTSEPEPPQPPIQPGVLTGLDWQIVKHLAHQEGTTLFALHTGLTEALARPTLNLRSTDERLARLARTGWCYPEPHPNNEGLFWHLTPAAQELASRRFPPKNP